jgi:hypothetical protein
MHLKDCLPGKPGAAGMAPHHGESELGVFILFTTFIGRTE